MERSSRGQNGGSAVELARENVTRNGFLEDLVDKSDGEVGDKVEAKMGDDSNQNGIDGDDKNAKQKIAPILTTHHQRVRGIHLQWGDATHEMYISHLPPTLNPNHGNSTQLHFQKTQYNVIDLDPYGSAAPFLDAAVQSICNGGMLTITCTDLAALGGSHPETCYGRYGAFPLQRSGYLQELALRILLYHLSVIAGRYGRTIKPILSVGMNFNVRVVVEVYDDKAGVSGIKASMCGL